MYLSQRSDRDAPSAFRCCSPQIRIVFSYGTAPQPQWHILQLFQGPIHATLELKVQAILSIDLVTLLSSLWCWQRAAYELAACLRHTFFSRIQTSFSGLKLQKGKLGGTYQIVSLSFHSHSYFAEFPGLSKGAYLPFLSWYHNLNIREWAYM